MSKNERANRAAHMLADALARLAPGEPQAVQGGAWRALFRRSAQPIALLAPDGTILELNDAAHAVVGSTPADTIGTPFWAVLPSHESAETRVQVRASVHAAAAGASVRHEIEAPFPAGPLTFDVAFTPLLDEAGQVVLILVDGRDVTSRKRAENSVRESEERFDRILSIAADAIISMDDAHRITLFNQGAEQVFGYAAHEVMGQTLDLLLPVHLAAVHRQHVRNFAGSAEHARRMGERRQIFGRRKNGEIFPAEASISRVTVGGKPVFTAVVRDITQLWVREAEREQLLAAATRAREDAERAREHIAFLVDVSDALNESLDYDQTLEVVARSLVPRMATLCLVDIIEDGRPRRVHAAHADPALHELADALRALPLDQPRPFWSRRVLQTGEAELMTAINREQLQAAAQDDAHLAVLRAIAPRSCICVPLIARGHTLGAITLMRDDTAPAYTADDLRFAQEIARRAALALDNARLYRGSQQATAQRDHVLSVVSHDLGNAVSSIALSAAALRGAAGANAEQRARLLSNVRESIDWMRSLIDDLLDISSIEAGGLSIKPVPTDPVLTVVRAVHLYEGVAAERSISLRLAVPEHLPAVMVDERRILQVFSNLLANAMRHTSPQGRVTLAAQAEKDAVIFTVEDTGTGIPAEHLPRIFDRFWHYRQGTAGKGTGLGLAIARGIVEAHGGRIWVESPPGQGATFRFTVPLSPVPAERPSDGESAATGASRARRSRQRAARHGLN